MVAGDRENIVWYWDRGNSVCVIGGQSEYCVVSGDIGDSVCYWGTGIVWYRGT